MSKKPAVIASGGVVLRTKGSQQEVLLVHRDQYDDWSLPKGKGKADELHPETAIREIEEETGVRARLGLRLPSLRYNVSKGTKVSHYWRASVLETNRWRPSREVDEIRWLSIPRALERLSYDDERELLTFAVEAPESVALLLVRHGKAMLRKNWSGPDHQRRLSSRGRAQAKALIPLLEAFGVERAVSSSAERCMRTLKPYASKAGIPLEGVDLLTEEEGEQHPKRVLRFLEGLRRELRVPTAVCGHRPVLPSMFKGLGVDPRPMVVGEGIAFHFDLSGNLLSTDVMKPTA